jgi:CRISPR-associated protein Cmr1
MHMRQPTPDIDPAAALNRWSSDATVTADLWVHYACKLVTPLYGGGVHAAEVDEAMPIRPSALHGQLRFWWRIACAPFASSTEMFRREAAIWGGIASTQPTASKVAVRVDRITGLRVEPAFVYQQNHNKHGELRTMPNAADWVEAYAMFPARGELTKDKRSEEISPHRLARAGLGFRLGMRLHPKLTAAQREEVNTALRWWASFGGVGARTRRGLGAVRVEGLTPVTDAEVAAKGGRLILLALSETPELAWKNSVGRLRQFRQGVDLGRNQKTEGSESPAGRSRWPEPDIIRRQTTHHSHGHAPTHPVTHVYPRAAFGLPIVFHFKDENKGEPPQQLLVPEVGDYQSGDRMTSPLILRPYWDGKAWRSAALLIPGWEAALQVNAGVGDGIFRPAWLRDPAERQRLAAQIKPMQGRGNDPLSAFMDYFEKG